LEGIALRIGNTVQGDAYGSLLPGGAFDVMVLKGNLDYRYIWRALLRELARTVLDRAPRLNLEEDLGPPGLRENKLSYQPCALLEKYQAVPVEYDRSNPAVVIPSERVSGCHPERAERVEGSRAAPAVTFPAIA